jgi:hypothetical protein
MDEQEQIDSQGVAEQPEAPAEKSKPARKTKKSDVPEAGAEQSEAPKRIFFVLLKSQSIVTECRTHKLHKKGDEFDAVDDAAIITALAKAGAPLEQIEK